MGFIVLYYCLDQMLIGKGGMIKQHLNEYPQLKPILYGGADNSATDANNRLCNSNPYIESFDSTLLDIELKSLDWLNQLEDHLQEARKPEMLKHTHQRFLPFQPDSTCSFSCIG